MYFIQQAQRLRDGISPRSGFIRQFCFIVSSVSRMCRVLDCAIIVVGCNEGLHARHTALTADVRGETNARGEFLNVSALVISFRNPILNWLA